MGAVLFVLSLVLMIGGAIFAIVSFFTRHPLRALKGAVLAVIGFGLLHVGYVVAIFEKGK